MRQTEEERSRSRRLAFVASFSSQLVILFLAFICLVCLLSDLLWCNWELRTDLSYVYDGLSLRLFRDDCGGDAAIYQPLGG